MEKSEILLHLGDEITLAHNPGSPALYQTSNFTFGNVAAMRQSLAHEDEIPFYTRGTNPTIQILQKKLAALEKMEKALIFSSGSAAIATAVMGNIDQGDHILSVSKPYSWTGKLLKNLLPRFGVESTLANGTDVKKFLENIQPNTKLIYLESPNSWTFEMQDLESIADYARAHDIITIVDNSYSSPINQVPADHGIDIVVHSATKYLGGHSDLVAGVLCASGQMIDKLFKSEFMTLGGIISPHDAWLMLRSLRTLPLRIEHTGSSAQKIVSRLEKNDTIEKVYYPFAESFPQKNLVEKYLKGPNGLFTIDLATKDTGEIEKFCNSLKKFKLACSWGSYESLAFPAIATISSQNYDKPDVVINRIRFSIGLDDPDILAEDIENALSEIAN